MYIYISIYLSIYTSIYTSISIYISIYIYVLYMHTCIHTYIYIYVHTCIYMKLLTAWATCRDKTSLCLVYSSISLYVYIYICMYVYEHQLLVWGRLEGWIRGGRGFFVCKLRHAGGLQLSLPKRAHTQRARERERETAACVHTIQVARVNWTKARHGTAQTSFLKALWGLKLLVCEASSYKCRGPQAASVCGLKLRDY